MNRSKYILATGILLSLIGMTAAQGGFTGLDNGSNTSDNSSNLSSNLTANQSSNATVNQSNTTQSNMTNNTTVAQEINVSLDTVILATTENYPDALTAAPAAEKIGAPILLTDGESLSSSTQQVIQNANVSNVIIVGGPSVISEEVENSVEQEVNSTTRLWGVTQIGTSAEIANYFWSESNEATVVHYSPYQNNESYKLLAAAKEVAAQDGEPLFITSGQNVSNKTQNAMDQLEVEEADVYSTATSAQLENLSDRYEGLDVEANMHRGSINDLVGQIQEGLIDQEPGNSVNFIAAQNFRDAISVPAYPEGPTLTVYSEDQINDTVSFLEDSDVSTIDIAGDQQLGNQIATNIESDAEIRVLSGQPAEVAAHSVILNAEQWSDLQEQALDDFEDMIDEQELEEELESLQDRLGLGNQPAAEEEPDITVGNQSENQSQNQTTNQTQNTTEVESLINEAQNALAQNNVALAKMKIAQANSELEENDFLNLNEQQIEDRINEEFGIPAVNVSANASNASVNLSVGNESENNTLLDELNDSNQSNSTAGNNQSKNNSGINLSGTA